MHLGKRAASRRGGWLLAFFILAVACMAVPVFAAASESIESEPSSSAGPAAETTVAGSTDAPSAEQIQQDVEADERAQDAKELWLETDKAVRQREESRHAFAAISASEAEGLLPLFFPDQLAALNADPARLLTDLEDVEPLGTHAALVSDEQGERSLLESTIPVVSEVGQGSKQPLDLDLERSGQSFVPKNPLAELSLPDSALGTVHLDSGLEIALPADAASYARPVENVGLIYPDTERDTDTILAPVTGGVEVFQQLRSPESPEALRFDIGLPPETLLTPTEAGGAEVISASKERIVSIPPPWAVDAQGTPVPVGMSVEGSSLTLDVPHRSRDLAYPILVDPPFIEENAPFGNWGPAWTDQYEMWNSPVLGIRAKGSSYSYAAGSFGHWVWTTHGATTYISAAGFGGAMFTLPSNCVNEAPTNHPHGYAGIYSPSTGGYTGLGFWSGGTHWTMAHWATGGGPGVRQAVVGLGVGSSSVKHKCAITFEVAGVTVQQQDPEAPTFNSVQASSDWVSGASNLSFAATVSDPGLGVKRMDVHPEGASEAPSELHHMLSCSGAYVDQCPASHYHQFSINPGQFQSGQTTTKLTAGDAIYEGAGHESEYPVTTRVDRTPPVVDLQGQLATITRQEGKAEKDQGLGQDELRFPVYNLLVKATDVGPNGNPAGNPWERRSGVKDIRIFLRDEELETEEELKVPWSPQGCAGPTYSCPMEKPYPLELAGREMGDYRLKVLVEDQVGRTTERKLKFTYIPATGMKDEYAMEYFPLPDGSGDEEHPSRPELAVNTMSGNLVFRQRDVDIEGASADLEVERFYNSLLPESEDTEWGDGWTLAQTPSLEPDVAGTPTEATMIAETGLVQSEVELPGEVGEEVFDPEVQATVSKDLSGYSVTDETGERGGTLVFDASGKATELETGEYSGVQYDYESGDLAEITVRDLASAEPLPEETEEPSFQSSFGTSGSANGQFNHPADVAIDAQRNLFVIDRENHRVQKFDGAGNFIKAFGSSGSGDGQFNFPSAIAVDPEGDVWVADRLNHRVQQFSKEGAYISKFGTGSSGPGQIRFPQGLAIDTAGNIYLAEFGPGAQGLQKFKPNGEFIKLIASQGSTPGQVSAPAGLDIDAEGNLWVADRGNSRIQAFDPAGNFLRQFKGAGAAAFTPSAIDVDGKGTVWVGDTANDRVQGFTPYGALLSSFGTEGSGEGQLELETTPSGMVADPSGDLWITDPGNQRVQRWLAGEDFNFNISFQHSFGQQGSANGQFNHPADVAIDAQRNLFVIDRENHRVQKFDGAGNFIKAFGSSGSGDGQFNFPSAIAVDPEGDVWVADRLNHRVQQFSKEGAYISKFGTGSSGPGQIRFPQGLAIDTAGNIYLAEFGPGAQGLQKFKPNGEFIKLIASQGSTPGQVSAPAGLDIDAEGNLWVADRGNSRIQAFDPAGNFLRQFKGAGAAAFTPSAIDVDGKGTVWVGDTANDRVQGFTPYGALLSSFGTEGSGEGQLELETTPSGMVADPSGDLWITDPGNQRVQRWLAGEGGTPSVTEDDARVEIEVDNGLVESLEGEEAGEVSYEHADQLLASVDGPDGETEYDYDEEFDGDDRLSKVTLPNGTYGQIAYDAKGRVKSITVSDEGAEAQTTSFTYQDEPTRRTTVKRPKESPIIYDFGEDGSLFKWQSEKAPPNVELSGSLFATAETPSPINAGDYELVVEAFSAAADLTTIQIIANGSTLVDEKTCEAPCPQEEDRWVTNTGNWAPGIVYMEVLVTDSNDEVSSRSFWVNIPYTPPPDPEAEAAPTFSEVLKFREEFGLDLDIKGDERALNDRIFDLIWAWNHPGTSDGGVARATSERWGSPLRPADAAELEYREWLYDVNTGRIDDWVEVTNPASYAGYYMDHKAGGIMHVGFTSAQAEQLESLKASLSLVGQERLQVYPTVPTHSYLQVMATSQSVMGAMEANSTLANLVVNVEDDEAGKATRVGTPNVAQVDSILDQMLGANAPVTVEYDAGDGALLGGRYRNDGRMRAGDYINSDHYAFAGIITGGPCTAGFGAEDRRPRSNGSEIVRLFLLTAGHCAAETGGEVWRNTYDGDDEFPFEDAGKSEVGTISRSAFQWLELGGVRTDGAAIRIREGGIVPQAIYGWNGHPLPTKPASKARKGNVVCYSGAISKDVSCGRIVARSLDWQPEGAPMGLAGYWVIFPEGKRPEDGDSGGPVWNLSTGASVGLISARRKNATETLVAPLLHPPNMPSDRVPGILHHQGMAPLQLKLGG
jgi:YD repeat-containing protein